MVPLIHHQLHSLHSSDPTAPSEYSGHEDNNRPTHPFGSSRPGMRTVHSDGSGHNSNDIRGPSTEPPRPNLYTAHSVSDTQTSQNLQPASHSYDPRPLHPIDPPKKPLIYSSHNAVPEPLAMQTPSSRLSQRRYQNLQRYLRIGKTISNVITMIFSTIVLGITLYFFITFELTKDDFRGGRTA